MRVRMGAALASAMMLAAACQSETPPVVEEDSTGESASEESATDDEPEPAPDPEAEPEPEPEPEPGEAAEAALAYFEALGESRPASLLEMVDLAAEGSPAELYARFQHAFTEARQQEGWPTETQEAYVTDEGVDLCFPPEVDEPCWFYRDLVVRDGQLANFTVNGEPIEDRLFAGDASDETGDVVAELVAAYHTITGDVLVVILDVENGSADDVSLSIYSADYLTADNRQVSASDAVGPVELRAGSSAYVALIFPSQGIGGTAYLPGWGAGSTELEWEIPLEAIDVAEEDDLSQSDI
jgi:hypothetical protein